MKRIQAFTKKLNQNNSIYLKIKQMSQSFTTTGYMTSGDLTSSYSTYSTEGLGLSSLTSLTTGTPNTALGYTAGLDPYDYTISTTPLTGTITIAGGTGVTTPYTLVSPSTWTFVPPITGPFMGSVEFDMETKTMKVFNGVEWIEIKMFNHVPVTPEDLEQKELSSIQDQIKKEIYG